LASAKIWRVNNQSTYNVNGSSNGEELGGSPGYPVFVQIIQALNYPSFSDGDTVHVEASVNDYNYTNVQRPCTLIGGGYFSLENDPIHPNELETKVDGIDINSSNVSLIGIYVNSGYTDLNGSNILVERCRFQAGVDIGYLGVNATEVYNGIFVRRNYFNGGTVGLQIPAASFDGLPTNVYIQNNIFRGSVTSNGNYMTITAFENNTIVPTGSGQTVLRINTGSFRNNILRGTNYDLIINGNNYANVTNNLGTTVAQFPANTGNQILPVTASDDALFIGSNIATATDKDFPLTPSQAATYLGNDGTQVGAFGGAFPYSISGVGPIPYIYEMQSTGVATPSSGLIINVSAKSSN
jgi:hypothetical protein